MIAAVRTRPIALVTGAGLLLRVVTLFSVAKHPADPRFVADPYAYLLMADHAYHGRYFVSFRGFPTAYLSVGYPFLIAVARHLLLGTVSVWVTALLLNLAAYVATTVALPRLVRAVLGDRGGTPGRQGAGLIAAVLFAVSPDAIFGTGLVMTELTAVAFLVWAVVLAAEAARGRGSRLTVFGAGLCTGMAVFERPSMVLLVVLVPLLVGLRRHWKEAVVVFCAALVPLLPLVVNNLRVGAGIGVTSATWPNVCDGLTDRQGRFEWRRECRVTMLPGESIDRNTEKRNVEWSRKISLLEIGDHPWVWVSRMPLRVAHSLWSGGWATEFSVRWAQNYAWTTKLIVFMRVSQAYFGMLVVGAVAGLIRAARRRSVRWDVLAVVSVGSLAGVPITFGQSRFGWPLAVIIVIPFAASVLEGNLGRMFPALRTGDA